MDGSEMWQRWMGGRLIRGGWAWTAVLGLSVDGRKSEVTAC